MSRDKKKKERKKTGGEGSEFVGCARNKGEKKRKENSREKGKKESGECEERRK